MRVTHTLDWGRTPGGKRYAVCTCGWRAPARSKLTHGISDVRDHLGDLRRICAEQGWQWWMIKPLGLITVVPDELDDAQVAALGVSLPTVVGGP